MLALPLRRSVWACAICLVLWSPGLGGVVSAQAENPAYQSVIKEAVGEFGAGHWAEARALFKRAHKESPNARTLRGMGMCAYELRMYVPALRELQGSLQERRRPLSAEQRSQVEKLIGHAANFVGRYKVSVTPPDANVTLDGKPAEFDPGNLIFLELGEHTIVASRAGHESATQRVRVEGAENTELHIELMPTVVAAPVAGAPQPAEVQPPQPVAPPAEPEPAADPGDSLPESRDDGSPALAIAGWVGVGLSVAAGITAAVYWSQGEQEIEDLGPICGEESRQPGCTQEQIDDSEVEKLDTAATIALVASIVTGTVGVTLIVIDAASGGAESASADARVQLGLGSLSVRGSF